MPDVYSPCGVIRLLTNRVSSASSAPACEANGRCEEIGRNEFRAKAPFPDAISAPVNEL